MATDWDEDRRIANGADVFHTGAIVYLRSGSPPLTVHSQRGDGYVDVEWFVDGIVCRDAFYPDCLWCGITIEGCEGMPRAVWPPTGMSA